MFLLKWITYFEVRNKVKKYAKLNSVKMKITDFKVYVQYDNKNYNKVGVLKKYDPETKEWKKINETTQ